MLSYLLCLYFCFNLCVFCLLRTVTPSSQDLESSWPQILPPVAAALRWPSSRVAGTSAPHSIQREAAPRGQGWRLLMPIVNRHSRLWPQGPIMFCLPIQDLFLLSNFYYRFVFKFE